MASETPGAPGAAKPQVQALKCPNCGAALTVRSFGSAVTVVCGSCHSILDAKDPTLKILQQFKVATEEDPPLIPLGTRGKLHAVVYEVIGFQRRTIHVDDVSYHWHEYLLFNPYQGSRYLTEYQGHWNDISACKALPDTGGTPASSAVRYLGGTYKHFQSAEAFTTFVLGEFPWQVRVGEQVLVTDYVKPPRVLSSERSHDKVTWSLGEYTDGRDLWKAFNLPGSPPAPVGVFENQPSPMSRDVGSVWVTCGALLLLLLALLTVFGAMARNESVLSTNYEFAGAHRGEASFVTSPFELKGRTADVQVETTADVNNSWIYLNYALINQDTGEAWDFGREVSYYHGYDSDGSWTEGSDHDSVVIPSVPPGNYYLRIEPEGEQFLARTISYHVAVHRDVPVLGFYGIAFVALLLPAILITWRSINFERLRWAESDHSPGTPHFGSDSEPDNPSGLGPTLKTG
jgi:Domain of unknown function (DUF4178)